MNAAAVVRTASRTAAPRHEQPSPARPSSSARQRAERPVDQELRCEPHQQASGNARTSTTTEKRVLMVRHPGNQRHHDTKPDPADPLVANATSHSGHEPKRRTDRQAEARGQKCSSSSNGSLLIGNSQAGKSSIAAARHRQKHPEGANDRMRIERVDDCCLLYPGLPIQAHGGRRPEQERPSQCAPGSSGGRGDSRRYTGWVESRASAQCGFPSRGRDRVHAADGHFKDKSRVPRYSNGRDTVTIAHAWGCRDRPDGKWRDQRSGRQNRRPRRFSITRHQTLECKDMDEYDRAA